MAGHSRARPPAAVSGLKGARRRVLLLRASTLCEHQTKAVFGLELMVGGSEHKMVIDKGGFRVYYLGVNWL